MKRIGIFVVSLFFVGALSTGFAVACECKPRTPPGEHEGSVKKTPTFDFSWFSDTDKKEDDRYCYERVVKNKHERNNLDYEWKIAEMDNKALPPKEQDRICKIRGVYRDAARGPLNYGRDNPPTDTEVWKAKSEPRTGEMSQVASFSPLETVLEFVSDIGGGRILRNFVILRSFVSVVDTPAGRMFRYRYLLENLRDEPVVLSWVPRLPEMVKADPRLAPLLKETPEGLAIEIRGIIPTRLDDKQTPMLGMFPVHFFEPGGKRMARGSAEAYVPPK